jgi:hypothetical protein
MTAALMHEDVTAEQRLTPEEFGAEYKKVRARRKAEREAAEALRKAKAEAEMARRKLGYEKDAPRREAEWAAEREAEKARRAATAAEKARRGLEAARYADACWSQQAAPQAPGATASPWQLQAPPQAPTATATRVVDLGSYLDGTFVAPEPSVGALRADGHQLLYPGRWHVMIALTGAGKSWWALWHAREIAINGGTVAYAHFEESQPMGTIARLRAVGCPDDVIRSRFVWLDCSRPWKPGEFAGVLDSIAGTPALVVLDGINASAGQHGEDPSQPSSVAQHRQLFVNPAVARGAAVLSLGHPPKARDRQGERHSFGSTAWLDEVDGAAFRLEADKEPIRRGHYGSSQLFTVKDRYGEIERHGVPNPKREAGWYAQGAFMVDDTSTQTAIRLDQPNAFDAMVSQGPSDHHTDTDDTVLRAVVELTGKHECPPSVNQVQAHLTMGKPRSADAITRLLGDGHLTESRGPRNARLLTVTTSPDDLPQPWESTSPNRPHPTTSPT